MSDLSPISVGIVGASGYGGVQLVRLILDHPHLTLSYLGGDSSAGQLFSELYPHLSQVCDLKIEPIDLEAIASRCQVVFLSLPNGLAWKMTPELLERGCKVLDLSADYRFSEPATYCQWYGGDRPDLETLESAVYGLPELYRNKISQSSLIGCPGCYPTASILALAPLLKQGLIDPSSIIIDAKSGTSGGGRQAKTNLLLAEADNSIAPYGVVRHRHTPEIEQICTDLAGQDVLLQFTPHLVPMPRGILATTYSMLSDPGLTREDLFTIYSTFYRNSAAVKLLPSGTYPQTKWALNTNTCYISIEVDRRNGRVIVMSAIDNLMKGQAGQAVQCLNIMMGWAEMLGLPKVSFYP